MKKTAFLMMRLGMGINMFFHAVNRFYYGTSGFNTWMAESFEGTFLPGFSVEVFSIVLPYVEGIIGLLLITGLKTRIGLIAGSLLMSVLILGACLISQWDWATYQMIYLLCFYFMMLHIDNDGYSFDHYFLKNTTGN